MDKLISKVKSIVESNHSRVVEQRRHIHANPELSFAEFNTRDYIQAELESIGIETIEPCTETGLVASIGNPRLPTLFLRADMDALPIQESNSCDYRSINPGVMHACGHDVHSATLLGVAQVLKSLESDLPYHVKCVFQPGEEKLPGGASLMLAAGLFDGVEQGRMLGNHVHPPLIAGTVGFKSGQYMASADELYLTIHGRGGHGAMPHLNIDPLPIVAELVLSLQQIVSRHADPATPTVLSFGKINSVGGATNIIPTTIKLEGTFRTFDEKWRQEAHRLMRLQVEHVCKAHRATADFDIAVGYPTLYNDPETTAFARQGAIDYLGEAKVIDLPLRTTSEDFSFYSQQLPSCFYRFGTSSAEGEYTSSVHTPTFDVDESCLITSVGLMAYLALKK